MISPGYCAAEAATRLAQAIGIGIENVALRLEIEFREVPYFIVSRSRKQWAEDQGDINAVCVVDANEKGILIDPDTGAERAGNSKRVFVPWTNVLSLSVSSAEDQ